MAAAPQYATLVLLGTSGQVYNTDVYLSDVADASANFDSGTGAGANSETFTSYDEPTVITDFIIASGMTDTKAVRITGNGKPSPNVIRYAQQLNSLNSRPALSIPVRANTRIGMVQMT